MRPKGAPSDPGLMGPLIILINNRNIDSTRKNKTQRGNKEIPKFEFKSKKKKNNNNNRNIRN